MSGNNARDQALKNVLATARELLELHEELMELEPKEDDDDASFERWDEAVAKLGIAFEALDAVEKAQ